MHKVEVRYASSPNELYMNVRSVTCLEGGVIEIEYQDGGLLWIVECKNVYIYPDDGEN